MSYNSPVLTLDLNPFFWEGIIGAWRERKREMCPHVSGLHGTNGTLYLAAMHLNKDFKE